MYTYKLKHTFGVGIRNFKVPASVPSFGVLSRNTMAFQSCVIMPFFLDAYRLGGVQYI